MKYISEQEAGDLFNRRMSLKLTLKELGDDIVSSSCIASWERLKTTRCNEHHWQAIQERLREFECDDANRKVFMSVCPDGSRPKGGKIVGDGITSEFKMEDNFHNTQDLVDLSWTRAIEAKKVYEEATKLSQESERKSDYAAARWEINNTEWQKLKDRQDKFVFGLWFLLCLDLILNAVLIWR